MTDVALHSTPANIKVGGVIGVSKLVIDSTIPEGETIPEGHIIDEYLIKLYLFCYFNTQYANNINAVGEYDSSVYECQIYNCTGYSDTELKNRDYSNDLMGFEADYVWSNWTIAIGTMPTLN